MLQAIGHTHVIISQTEIGDNSYIILLSDTTPNAERANIAGASTKLFRIAILNMIIRSVVNSLFS